MIAYITNIWNHYQGPLGYEMANRLGVENFRMGFDRAEDDPISQFRLKLGWNINPPNEPWIIPNPKTSSELKSGPLIDLIKTADVMIIGALSGNRDVFNAIMTRIRAGKLTFFTGERFFKKPRTWVDYVNPRRWLTWGHMHYIYNRKNVHYLPISYYCPEDLRFLRVCKGRMWRWAYFPPVSEEPTQKPRHERLELGWCGRMIDWKHVEYAIQAVALLSDDVRKMCHLTLIGRGDMEEHLKNLAKELGVQEMIDFKPAMTPEDIAEWMKNLDVYLFPSDRGEGWGVVLAEAMDKCCVAIACDETGATLNLIKDGENGFVFKKGDIETMAKRIEFLVKHPEERTRLGKAAWETMQSWSASVGAQRLIVLVEHIQTGRDARIFESGLCSCCG